MPLPDFNSDGDLPEGVYQAAISEVVARFGGGTAQRRAVTRRLVRIFALAGATEQLDRMVIFGSYITAKLNPNDVDVLLIFSNEFDMNASDEVTRSLLDHSRADEEFGASVFWIRPGMLLLEPLEEFVAHWQIKRDGTRRGIVEVRP